MENVQRWAIVKLVIYILLAKHSTYFLFHAVSPLYETYRSIPLALYFQAEAGGVMFHMILTYDH